MIFQPSMKKILAERGYHHCKSDEEFTLHGAHARNIQYAFSKEFEGPHEKIVDIIFLGVDVVAEKLVIGFFRENVSIENGIMESADVSIPLSKFSMEEFAKRVDKLIPRGNPLRGISSGSERF
jgi:hypothetical protein